MEEIAAFMRRQSKKRLPSLFVSRGSIEDSIEELTTRLDDSFRVFNVCALRRLPPALVTNMPYRSKRQWGPISSSLLLRMSSLASYDIWRSRSVSTLWFLRALATSNKASSSSPAAARTTQMGW